MANWAISISPKIFWKEGRKNRFLRELYVPPKATYSPGVKILGNPLYFTAVFMFSQTGGFGHKQQWFRSKS